MGRHVGLALRIVWWADFDHFSCASTLVSRVHDPDVGPALHAARHGSAVLVDAIHEVGHLRVVHALGAVLVALRREARVDLVADAGHFDTGREETG